MNWTKRNFYNFDSSFTVDHNLILKDKGPTKIDCGLKEVDAGKYKRNYYINESKEKKIESEMDPSLISFRWSEPDVSNIFKLWITQSFIIKFEQLESDKNKWTVSLEL